MRRDHDVWLAFICIHLLPVFVGWMWWLVQHELALVLDYAPLNGLTIFQCVLMVVLFFWSIVAAAAAVRFSAYAIPKRD